MWEDPIVAEVHLTREKLAAKFNYDIDAFFADIFRRQAESSDQLVWVKKQAERIDGVESSADSDSSGRGSKGAAPAA